MNNSYPIREINSSGFFGYCDGCNAAIEGRQVQYFEIVVNPQGGHRHYCDLPCLHSSEDLS